MIRTRCQYACSVFIRVSLDAVVCVVPVYAREISVCSSFITVRSFIMNSLTGFLNKFSQFNTLSLFFVSLYQAIFHILFVFFCI